MFCNWTLFFTARLSAVNWTGFPSFLSLPYRAQLNCQPSTIWVPGWSPFHTNLQVISSQPDFQLTTELSHSPTNYFTSLNPTCQSQSQSQNQSYFMTGDLPPISSAWCQAPWDSRPSISYFNWTLAVIVPM
jgi:hypothetical protein